MLNFSLDKLPPTVAEIESEKERLKTAVRDKKLILCLVAIFAIAVAIGTAIAAFGIGYDVFAVAGPGCMIGMGVGGCAVLAFYRSVGVIFCVSSGAILGSILGSAIDGVFGANIGSSAGAVVVICASFFVNHILEQISEYRWKCSSLSGLDEESHQNRCPAVLEACKKDVDCEAYRLAVARQGRPLTIVEAKIIENWVAGAEKRQREENSVRQQQVACAMLKSPEAV